MNVTSMSLEGLTLETKDSELQGWKVVKSTLSYPLQDSRVSE